MESIKNRTSIRKYAEKEVSEELLNRLLEEAERTPTMGNLQLYSVVVTRSEEGKKALAHHLCRLSPHNPSGQRTAREPRAMTTFSFMNAATDALLFHPDLHEPGRRSRVRHLFPGNYGLYAKDDYRHPEAPS